MRARVWPGVAVLSVFVFAAVPARGQQDAGPTSDEQATMTEVQQTFQKIIGNMIAKGMNPRDFFQQFQSGADPSDIAKQLVDQGLIDQASLTKLQTDVQKMTSNRIRGELDVTDDEWAVLEPMVRKVMTAQAALQRAGGGMGGGRGGMGGMMGGFMNVQTPAGTDLSQAARTLRAALASQNASGGEVAAALTAYRQAHARAAADLVAAQRDLMSAVTVRQEAALQNIGILE